MSWVKGHISSDSNRYLLSEMARESENAAYSYKRLFTSILILIAAGFAIYIALPYATAFRQDSAVGVSQFKQIGLGEAGEGLEKYSRVITKRFGKRPVYLREGQRLTAYYALPKGAQITMNIRRCANKPIIEVFKCDIVDSLDETITPRVSGSYPFTANTAGMYIFTETVILPDKNLGQRHENYEITWRRN